MQFLLRVNMKYLYYKTAIPVVCCFERNMKAYILKIMLANLIYLWKTVKHKTFYIILLFFSYTNSRRKGNLNKYFKQYQGMISVIRKRLKHSTSSLLNSVLTYWRYTNFIKTQCFSTV